MLRMLWTGEYDAEWEARFRQVVQVKRAGFNLHNQFRHWMTEEEVIAALQGMDIFFVGYDPVTEGILDRAPELKLILSERDGPEENIDLAACRRRGIPVLNSAGRCTVSVAELTMNLILNMSRPVLAVNRIIRQEGWSRENDQKLRDLVEANSFEVYRKTLGIVGMGRNGRHLASLARGFGMRVIGYDPFVDPASLAPLEVTLTPLEELMRESDYVSILARATAENRHMVGARELGLMKPTAALVNTGRPQLVDYDALIQALEADRLRMAAIDVFSPEPLPPDSPFYRLPEHKVILTSHMAGFCQERAWHQYDKGMDNLMRFLRGEGLCCNCTPGVEESPDYPVRGGSLFGSLSC